MWKIVLFLTGLCACSVAQAKDYFFTASDGARLHYAVQGPAHGHVVVFVPGWTMPSWIFAAQVRALRGQFQVVLFDPRGQGASDIAPSGYDQARRGRDIGELLAQFRGQVVVVGWSLGVLDTLAYVHQAGDARLAGLVLIDNSVGENPPPARHIALPGLPLSHDAFVKKFVRGMFKTPQSPDYLDRLTQASLTMPPQDAKALLHYDVPRSFWREAILGSHVPVLYAIRPQWQAQAGNLAKDRPGVSVAVFPDAGHALFVDEAGRFDAIMENFLNTKIW